MCRSEQLGFQRGVELLVAVRKVGGNGRLDYDDASRNRPGSRSYPKLKNKRPVIYIGSKKFLYFVAELWAVAAGQASSLVPSTSRVASRRDKMPPILHETFLHLFTV